MASVARCIGRVLAATHYPSVVAIRGTLHAQATTATVHRPHQGPQMPVCARGVFTASYPRFGVVCFKLADIGEGIASVELTKWYKNVGDHVEEMDGLCEVQSDKAAVEITSRYTGKIVKLYAKEGQNVKIGDPLIDIDSPDIDDSDQTATRGPSAEEQAKEAEIQQPEKPASLPPSSKGGEGLASPAVRRFAKEKGVNLDNVTGSGLRGAITKEDILKFLSSGNAASSSAPSGATSAPLSSRATRENKEVLLQGFSKAMVKAMNESLKVPQMNIGDEYDLTRLSAVRQVLNKQLASQNIKISHTAFLIKALSIAIDEYPIVNSKFNTETQNSYTEFGSHNISIAIDTPAGLTVPCIKNVQDLTLLDIQSELVRLQGLAKTNRLSPSDLTGGTIALSNVGVISGTYIHPILFDGQAVILGVGRLTRVPRFVDRETANGMETSLEARDIINCSFTADHRHCDGATITRFSKRIKTLLEDPELMLAYLK